MPLIITTSPAETEAVGKSLGKLLISGDVLCLNGELGAGKTCFARGVARGLGIEEPVTSPTFTLINEYIGREPFYHFDVYRLGGPEEMNDLGYEEYFYGQGVALVEWGELVNELLPPERLDIWLSVPEEHIEHREIRLVPYGERYCSLAEEMLNSAGTGN
jgi:tRNA threonylcarbamoyladenosine biosynthesis protein TsaE